MATVSTGTQTDTADDGLRLSSTPTPTGNFGGRIKYAEPKDLPSYPSLGLKKDDAAASAAASLGWANTNNPLPLSSPNKNASAKRAASLANESTKQLGKRASMPASAWGNSAANQAFAAATDRGNARPGPREPMSTLERQKSLRAAKGAMGTSARPRSHSGPLTYPDSENAASNALSAATIAQRPSGKHRPDDAGASPITNMSRQMYTSHPPVKPEVDEKNREAVLHASAVAMANKMFARQQKILDSAKQAQAVQQAGNQSGESRSGSAGTDGLQQQQPMPYTNLQEAAYKLAQERLARLHEEHQKNKEFADYYGTSSASPSTPGKKLSKISRFRRRASSEGDATAPAFNDRNQSRQIRKQMSLFSTRLGEVDEAQRSRDREALMAAAERNVKAQLEGMDEKMYQEQGKIAPSKLSEWELKAHAAAQARSDARTGYKTDQIDLGAGAYMDRAKVQEIAAKRVQPVLDEINEKAQTEHLRVAASKAEQEKKRMEAESEKARNAEIKETTRQLREEEKARNKQLKIEAKAAIAQEKRRSKEQRVISDEDHYHHPASGRQQLDEKAAEETTSSSQHKHRLSRPFTPKIQTKGTSIPTRNNEASPLSPVTSPESANESAGARVKNWLRSRLQKPRAKSISVIKSSNSKINGDKAAGPGGFIGGHTLTRFRHADGTGSMTSLSEAETRSGASMREVALAGRPLSPPFYQYNNNNNNNNNLRLTGGNEPGQPSGATNRPYGRIVSNNSSFVSSVSGANSSSTTVEDGGEHRESRARTNKPAPLDVSGMMAPPRALVDPARVTLRSGGSPNRDSKFIEMME